MTNLLESYVKEAMRQQAAWQSVCALWWLLGFWTWQHAAAMAAEPIVRLELAS